MSLSEMKKVINEKVEGLNEDETLYQFVISISTGEMKFDQILAWLGENTESL